MADNIPFKITKYVTPQDVLNEIAARIDKENELPPGATAGPPPCSLRLAALAIEVLGQYGFLDGDYYRLVKYAAALLDPDQP